MYLNGTLSIPQFCVLSAKRAVSSEVLVICVIVVRCSLSFSVVVASAPSALASAVLRAQCVLPRHRADAALPADGRRGRSSDGGSLLCTHSTTVLTPATRAGSRGTHCATRTCTRAAAQFLLSRTLILQALLAGSRACRRHNRYLSLIKKNYGSGRAEHYGVRQKASSWSIQV